MGKKRLTTLLDHIDIVIESAKEYGVNEEFYQVVKKSINLLSKRLGVTKEQALVFALCMEYSNQMQFFMSEVTKMVGLSNLRTLMFMEEADKLCQNGLMVRFRRGQQTKYNIPVKVIDAIKTNQSYKPEPIDNLSEDKFYTALSNIFNSEYSDETHLQDDLINLVKANSHIPFVIALSKYGIIDCCRNTWDMLLICVYANRLINNDDDIVAEHDWIDYFTNSNNIATVRFGHKNATMKIFRSNLIELNNNYGDIEKDYYYHFTSQAKRELFPNHKNMLYDKIQSQTMQSNGIINFNSIEKKNLYFNEMVQKQINQLTHLLKPKSFDEVVNRLSENGMRKGFACLFYGAPGTGKTEVVNQIALATNRNIMMVDISKIRDMWVGNSEKNIKAVFDRYRKLSQESELALILLFNEADAILGVRNSCSDRAVDKMENAIQNILLQELENLDGIMIATTNLVTTLDKAFERRFIYKIEFEKPDFESRKKIWHSMMPSMSVEDIELVASKFQFSGGQIENVARRRVVELVLNGVEPTIDDIVGYCQIEGNVNCSQRNVVGYKNN